MVKKEILKRKVCLKKKNIIKKMVKKIKSLRGKKQAQVWVESVVYVGIMLALIGIVLAVVRPEIEKRTDRTIIEQAEFSLQEIDFLLKELEFRGSGNLREYNLNVKKGIFTIIPVNNTILFEIKSKYIYSQLEQEVPIGKIKSLTSKFGDDFLIKLSLVYSDIEIEYNNKEEEHSFYPSKNPVTLLISHLGLDEEGKAVINFELK